MNNLREIKNDLLKDWLLFRGDEISTLSCDEDRKHWVYFRYFISFNLAVISEL